jgi:predicted MFS family arabinose efflux permease
MRQRYFQLFILIIASGSIYPVVYMRQNFEVSMLETYGISLEQLGECHSILGLMFFLTYLPSGWLSDRFNSKWLLASSMAGTGLLALWLSTAPSFAQIKLIYIGWGITSGLTLWGALIKSTSLLAPHDQQGRFFGILESGRGIVEALLATIGVAIFAYLLESVSTAKDVALIAVVQFYACAALVMAPIIFWALHNPTEERIENVDASSDSGLLSDFAILIRNPSIWLAALTILIGYQMFWVTYSLAGLLESVFELSAVTVGSITLARLWMRPIGGVLAGFIGDYFNVVKFLAVLMLLSGAALASLPLLPPTTAVAILFPMVMLIGVLSYGVRVIFWATLDSCNVSSSTRGLAVGMISLIAYTPDIYVPAVQSWCLEHWSGQAGYQVYYAIFGASSIVGFFAAHRLIVLSHKPTQ